MATVELGTTANDSLQPAIVYQPGYGSGMLAADIATIAQAILDDQNVTHPVWPQAFTSNGILYVPNRGFLKMLPGDMVGVDSAGWPVLVSAYSIANAAWTVS